jgi:hypothetical protein
MKRELGGVCAALAVAGFCNDASAKTVTLDFEGINVLNGGSLYDNLVIEGFRFSPGCHLHVSSVYDAGYNGSQWMGWDSSGCPGINTNVNALGVELPGEGLYVDYFGGTFTLDSFYSSFGGLNVISSNGGFLSTIPSVTPLTYAAEGSAWDGVTWIYFYTPYSLGAPVGFDNLRLSDVAAPVPEGPTIAMWGLGLLAVTAFAQRRKTKAARASAQP